jgi:predicted DsbA family dithiol-disulfide isomerase
MMQQLKTTAFNLGLELGDRKKTYNSRLAQELGLWAETQGKGHEFHLAAFKTYFVAGKNIADKNVLLDLAESVCLPKAEAREVIDNRTFSDTVDQDWELSRQKGVTAVPTFFMGLDRLVGAKPYEVLDKMVARHTAPGTSPGTPC